MLELKIALPSDEMTLERDVNGVAQFRGCGGETQGRVVVHRT